MWRTPSIVAACARRVTRVAQAAAEAKKRDLVR